MINNLYKYISIFAVFVLMSSTHALESSNQQAPKDKGLIAWVELDGDKKHSSKLLARLKDGIAMATAERLLKKNGMIVNRRYNIVSDLIDIDLNSAKRKEATSWNAEKLKTNLIKRRNLLIDSDLFRYVEYDSIMHADAVPTDAAFQDGRLWGLNNIGQDGGTRDADIDSPESWDITTGNKNVVVAVCDTGIRYTHLDLQGQIWTNEDEVPGNGVDDDNDGYIDNIYGADTINNDGDPMDGDSHGTHVAGTIGAKANDENPHVGVAWDVQLMAVKCLSDAGWGTTTAVIASVDFATKNGASICNLSLGGGAFSQAFLDVIIAAADANVILVCAAGNSGTDNDSIPHYPSSYDVENVIAVAATDRNDNLAGFSCFGLESVDLAAPGVEIFSSTADSDSSYDSYPGTSMATPHVAGVIALMRSLQADWSYLQIREKLFASVDPLPVLDGKVLTGGRLNAFAAIEGMDDGVGGGLIPDGILEVGIVPASGSILLANTSTNVFVTIFDGPPVTNAIVSAMVEINNVRENYFFNNLGDDPDAIEGDNIYSNTITLPKNGGKMRLSLFIDAPDKQSYVRVVQYDVVPIPANDNFKDALKISGLSGVVEGYNNFATLEDNEPIHAKSDGQAGSLWWDWSPSADGMMYADVAGSDGDTTLAVYVGTDIGNLDRMVDNSPIDKKRPNFVRWQGRKGRTYRIAVASLSESQRGYVRLRTEVDGLPDINPPIIKIDTPRNGIVSVTNRVEISGYALDPKPNSSGVKEVFIVQNGQSGLTVIGTQKWNLSVFLFDGLNTFDVYGVDYSGNVSNGERLIIDHRPPTVPNDHFVNALSLNREIFYGNAERLQFPLSQSVTDLDKLKITLDGEMINFGDVTLSELNNRYIVFAEPPADGSIIEVFHPEWNSPLQNTIQATRERGEPQHSGNEGGGSIWYNFVAPEDGLLSLNSKNADFDTILGIYMGNRVDQLILLATNDDDPELSDVDDNPGVSRIDQALEGGMEVYIAVDGFGAKRGNVSLSSIFTPIPIHRLSVTVSDGGKLISDVPQPFKDGEIKYTLISDENSIKLQVAPEVGNVFQGWSGSANSFDNPLDLPITKDIHLKANFVPRILTENFETGDFGKLRWKTSGDAKWFVQHSQTSGSKFSAQAGNIDDGQSSSLILDADFTEGEGSFEVRISSEKTWDKLEFLIDGRTIQNWTGINDWGIYSFQISPGKHRLEWRYQKDFANSDGEDSAWLDNIDLPLQLGASLALEPSGDTARLRLWGSAGHRYDVEVSSDFVNWERWDSVFIDAEGVKLLEKVIDLNGTETRFFRAIAP